MDSEENSALFAQLYRQLRQIADRELRRNPAAGVSPTTLVHEAYLKLADRTEVRFDDAGKYLGYIARAMRRLLIDLVRERQAIKRGGNFHIVEINTAMAEELGDERSLANLSDALDALSTHSPLLAELVDLRYFCGLSFADIARLRDVSERTVQRDWQKARLVLHRMVNDEDTP